MQVLPDILGELDQRGIGTGQLQAVALESLKRIDALYEICLRLLANPERLAQYDPGDDMIGRDLAVLDGWLKFAFLLVEVLEAPILSIAGVELITLAQILTHQSGAAAQPLPGGNMATRLSAAPWPVEMDPVLYYVARNERLLRALLLCDAKEDRS
jgi:hypothetical protein